jgi:hypothetical protein
MLSDINDLLRSFESENNHETLDQQENNPSDYFLQSAHGYQSISIYHTTLQEIPDTCQFLFVRNMIFNITLKANESQMTIGINTGIMRAIAIQ